MHQSLTRSAVLMLLLLFALGNFVVVQSGLITRDVDNGQLTDNRRNLQTEWNPLSLFMSRRSCNNSCQNHSDCASHCICTFRGCGAVNG
uniref:P_Vc9.2 prepropeptide n=1 Tax=Conus victoriae TaxID=319920 RepID=W4VSK8_CONVC